MSNRNTGLGVGAVIIVVVIIAFALFHKSNNTTPASSSNPYSSTPAASNNSSNSSTPAASTGIITTKTDSSGTKYLADGKGAPLYTYGGDTSGTSNCTGACLVTWPIYSPTSSSASQPANVTIITRSDNKTQYAYKGLPLYYFSSDNGTPTGDGVGDFHLATP